MNETKIFELLTSSDSDDRREGIYQIQQDTDGYLSEDSRLLKEIVRLLEDDVKGVRDSALNFLIDHQYESVIPRVIKLLESERIEVRNLATELLFSYGELSLPYLYLSLQSEDHDVRKFTVDILGAISCEDCVDKISELIDDPDPNVRFSVLEAFGNIGNLNCAPVLQDAYNKYPDMRSVILETIGKLKLKEFLPLIVKSLNSEEPIERFAAIEALGILGSVDHLKELDKLLEEADEFYQPEIVRSIARIAMRTGTETNIPFRKPEYITHLIEQISEFDYHVTEFIRANLHKIIQKLSRKEWGDLFQKLDDEMKYEFLNYLRENSPEDLSTFVSESFQEMDMSGKNQILDQAGEYIDRNILLQALESDDEWLSFRILEILESEEIESLIPKLVEWIVSYNEIRQLSARTAFSKLGIESLSDFLDLIAEKEIKLSEEAIERVGGIYNG